MIRTLGIESSLDDYGQSGNKSTWLKNALFGELTTHRTQAARGEPGRTFAPHFGRPNTRDITSTDSRLYGKVLARGYRSRVRVDHPSGLSKPLGIRKSSIEVVTGLIKLELTGLGRGCRLGEKGGHLRFGQGFETTGGL